MNDREMRLRRLATTTNILTIDKDDHVQIFENGRLSHTTNLTTLATSDTYQLYLLDVLRAELRNRLDAAYPNQYDVDSRITTQPNGTTTITYGIYDTQGTTILQAEGDAHPTTAMLTLWETILVGTKELPALTTNHQNPS